MGDGHLVEMYCGISDSVGGLQMVQGFICLFTSRIILLHEFLRDISET